MRKLIFVLLMLVFCRVDSNAATFNYTLEGDNSSNEILKEFIRKDFSGFDGKVISYYYDIDLDGIEEIIGIVKSNLFYNLEGYKLIVLKQSQDSWVTIDSDIYFDLTQDFNIERNKVTYYTTTLNKSKKHEGKISNKTSAGFNSSALQKNIANTQKVLRVSEGKSGQVLEAMSFNYPVQRAVRIDYRNLSDRTKHYLEMK